MMGQIIHKALDIDEIVTGRFHKDPDTGLELPIIGALFKNGLNRKKNGVILPVNTSVFAQNNYEFTHKVDEARAILRFGDSSGNSKKHLFGIEDDEENWLNVKLDRAGHEMSGVSGNKPTFPHADGLTVEHIPRYNGIKTNYRLGSSGINEIIVTFKYNQELTPEQRGNTIVFTRDGIDIFIIAAPFAYDDGIDLDHIEPVAMTLTETGGFASATLKVDSLWVAGAADPVIDPTVTIDDVSGTILDTVFSSYYANLNYNNGAGTISGTHRNSSSNQAVNWSKVDLSSYVGVTVTSSYWGFDVYEVFSAPLVSGYKCLRDIIEGTKTWSLASDGEPTWNSYSHPTAWDEGGARGAGTDRAATEDNSQLFSINSDLHFAVSASLTQSWIDDYNYGEFFDVPDFLDKALWGASETSTRNKPYFYMEYTEGGITPVHRGMAGGFNQLTGGMQ